MCVSVGEFLGNPVTLDNTRWDAPDLIVDPHFCVPGTHTQTHKQYNAKIYAIYGNLPRCVWNACERARFAQFHLRRCEADARTNPESCGERASSEHAGRNGEMLNMEIRERAPERAHVGWVCET